jgi:hypothetical protein
MKFSKLLVFLLFSLFGVAPCAHAQDANPIETETLILDVPTADVFDRYQASFLTRAYDHGTVMQSIDFGVYPRINIGISLAVSQLIGSSSSVRVLDPDFQVKLKLYDGNLYLPAIAIGYDGRRYGYGYNKERVYAKTKEFLDDRKGGYLTLTREVFVPGLHWTGGANISDLDWDDIYAFTGFYYKFVRQATLLAEWDNINNIRDSRVNLGLRVYLHPALALDGAVRRIGRGDESERILQIHYVTTF